MAGGAFDEGFGLIANSDVWISSNLGGNPHLLYFSNFYAGDYKYIVNLSFIAAWKLSTTQPGWIARYMHTLSYRPVANSIVITGGAEPENDHNIELNDDWDFPVLAFL